MADIAMADQVDLDTVFTDLVRVETRLYNAVTERLKAAAGIGAGHFELLHGNRFGWADACFLLAAWIALSGEQHGISVGRKVSPA